MLQFLGRALSNGISAISFFGSLTARRKACASLV
jgi:hypothetical protein